MRGRSWAPVNLVRGVTFLGARAALACINSISACGYTNIQIAHKLYITVSTVEQHLARVYRKLGVTGRAELPIDI